VVQVDFYLSNAAPGTPLWQLARVATAEQRLEACRQRRKSEAGLADDEVRHGTGWHHHQTLALLAAWFLVTETLRGKKMDASDDGTADTGGHRGDLVQRVSGRDDITYAA
jgi:SRSO17 transposase